MIGGYNKFAKNSVAEKTYSLPPHDFFYFQIDIFQIDSNDGESFYVAFDGVLTENLPKTLWPDWTTLPNACGNSYGDAGSYTLAKTYSHSNPTLTVKL